MRHTIWAGVIALAVLGATRATGAPASQKAGFLGVAVSRAEETVREQLKLRTGAGLTVQEVVADSPADKAGLKKHDILEKLDDQLLVNEAQLVSLVRGRQAGDKVSLGIIRQGQPQSVEVTLGEQEVSEPSQSQAESQDWWSPRRFLPFKPHEFRRFEFKPFAPGKGWPFVGPDWGPSRRDSPVFLGVEVRPVDAALAAQLDLPADTGVIVGHVVPKSPAEKAQLDEHDIILKLDQEAVRSPEDFVKRIQKMKKDQRIKLEVLRRGKKLEVEATLSEREAPDPKRLKTLLREFKFAPRVEVLKSGDRAGEAVIRFELIDPAEAAAKPGVRIPPPGAQKTQKAVMVVRCDQGVTTIKEEDGNRLVTVKDRQGKVLFDGPVNNAAQKAALPPDIRRRLEDISIDVTLPPAMPQHRQELRILAPERSPHWIRFDTSPRVEPAGLAL
jgi:membrane-associated protease RseP (regulator of RpoE activity)